MAGQFECHLLEAEEAVGRVVEGAFPAFAAEHAVLLPHLLEIGAEAAQFLDQKAQAGVVEMRAAMGAEFGDDATCALLPIADQQPRTELQEDEAQQIAPVTVLWRPVEPAGKESFRGQVPGARIPIAVSR